MVQHNYTLTFSSTELNQLLKICYAQQVVSDDVAITMIAKANEVLLAKGAMRNIPNALGSSQTDFAALENQAAEAYYRYREQNRSELGKAPSYAGSAYGGVEMAAPMAPSAALDPNGSGASALASSSEPLMVHSPASNLAGMGGLSDADSLVGSIARSLDQMATYLAQQNPLGFSQEALHQVIYCDGGEGSTWYYRDKTLQKPVLISAPVLTCKVQRLEFVQQEGAWKLKLYVLAERPYCLEANYNSAFSKALLLAIASLEPSQLRQPISLEVLPTQAPHGLTCRVYSQGVQIMHYFGPNPQWREVARRAITQVEAASSGGEQQPPEPAPNRSANSHFL